MKIKPQERLWWSPVLTVVDSLGSTVDVGVTDWEASFDSGTTWKSSQNNSGVPGWLVAGPDFPGAGDSDDGVTADYVVTGTIKVWVRLKGNPETVILDNLKLQLVTPAV